MVGLQNKCLCHVALLPPRRLMLLNSASATSAREQMQSSLIKAFSTSPTHEMRTKRVVRRNRQPNKERGVSAMRATGTYKKLGAQHLVDVFGLPKPVQNIAPDNEYKTPPDHGLWGFFSEGRTVMRTPEQENACGKLYDQIGFSHAEHVKRPILGN